MKRIKRAFLLIVVLGFLQLKPIETEKDDFDLLEAQKIEIAKQEEID